MYDVKMCDVKKKKIDEELAPVRLLGDLVPRPVWTGLTVMPRIQVCMPCHIMIYDVCYMSYDIWIYCYSTYTGMHTMSYYDV